MKECLTPLSGDHSMVTTWNPIESERIVFIRLQRRFKSVVSSSISGKSRRLHDFTANTMVKVKCHQIYSDYDHLITNRQDPNSRPTAAVTAVSIVTACSSFRCLRRLLFVSVCGVENPGLRPRLLLVWVHLVLTPVKSVSKVAKATEPYKGFSVSVQLTIVDRQATIVIVPTTSTLLIQALKEPSRDRKKNKNVKHNGSLSLDTIIDIARQMRAKSMAKTLVGTVKEVLRTAQAMGALCKGQNAQTIQRRITNAELVIPSE
jgi:large subunit ribosomal protein L12e